MEHVLDGTAIRSKDEFLDAVAAALSFPDWFGHNLDALYDSLRDLSWLPPGEHVLVWSAPEVLERADPGAYDAILDVLRDASEPGVLSYVLRPR
ncbi:barstar family protein [Actinophytocola sp.]|uniref:barstar family protein n=1 Tax=Actinophytocola sp. TaxID=1872138 RepID=UPI002ED93187